MEDLKEMTAQERAEFKGCMVDIIEDFCDEVGISIANAEKEDSDCPAHIYGTDYDRIGQAVEDYVEGDIQKEEVAVRMVNEFIKIISERGGFTELHDKLEQTCDIWSKAAKEEGRR